jgi:hypothetical protein
VRGRGTGKHRILSAGIDRVLPAAKLFFRSVPMTQ